MCTFAITQLSSCLSWGSWESLRNLFSLYYAFYILIFSHPSYSLWISMFDIIAHRLFYSDRTVSVCILTLYSVFVLCFFTPHTFGGIYIWRTIYIWRPISVRRALRSSKTWIILTLSIPSTSKMATLIFRDLNYVFRDIHFVCAYTPCLYTRYT